MLFVGGLAALLLTSFAFAQKDVDVPSTAEGETLKAHRGLPVDDGPHGVKFPSPLRDSIREGPTPLGRFTKPLIAGVKTAEVIKTDGTDSVTEDGGDVESIINTPEPEVSDAEGVTASTETTTVVTTPANALSRLLSKKKTNVKPESANKKSEAGGHRTEHAGRTNEAAAESSVTRSLPGRRQRTRSRTEPRVTTPIPSTEATHSSAESPKLTTSPKTGNKRFGGSRLSLGHNKPTPTSSPVETSATSESPADSSTSATPHKKAPLSKFQPRRPVALPSRPHEAQKADSTPSSGHVEVSSEPGVTEISTDDFKRTQPIRRRRPNLSTRVKPSAKINSEEQSTTSTTNSPPSETRAQVPDKRKGLFSSRPSKLTTTSATTSPRTGLDDSGELTLGTTHLPNEDLTISKNTVQADETQLLESESRLNYRYNSFGDNDPIVVQLEGDDMFAEGSRRFPFLAPSRAAGLRTRAPEGDQDEQPEQLEKSDEELTDDDISEKENDSEIEEEEKEEHTKETTTPGRTKKVKNAPKEQPAQEVPTPATNSFLARLGERRKQLGLRSGSLNKQNTSPAPTDPSVLEQTSDEAQEVAPSEERFTAPEPKRAGRRNLRSHKFRFGGSTAAESSDEVVAEGARHSPLTVVDTDGGEVKDVALEEEDDASNRQPKRTLLPRKNFALASLLSTRRQSSTEKDSSESTSGEVTEASVSEASKEITPKTTKKPPRKNFSKSPKTEEQTEEPIQKEEESKEAIAQQDDDQTTKPTLVGNQRRPVGGGLKDLLSRRKPGGGRLATPTHREHSHPKEENSETSEKKKNSEPVEDKASRFRPSNTRPSRNRFQPKAKPESNDADHDVEERLQKLEEKETQTSSKKKFDNGRVRPKFGKHHTEKKEETSTESKEVTVKEQPQNRPARRPHIRKGEQNLGREEVTEKSQPSSTTETPVIKDEGMKIMNESKELNMTDESSTEMDVDSTTMLMDEEGETTTMEGITEIFDSEITEKSIVGFTVLPEITELLDEATEKTIDFLNVKPAEEDKNIRTIDLIKEKDIEVLVEEDKTETIPQEEEVEVPVVRRKGGRRRRKNKKNKKQQQEGQEDDSPAIEEGPHADFESSRSGLKQSEFDYSDQIWEAVDRESLDFHQSHLQRDGGISPFSRDNTEVLPSPDS